MATGNIAFSSLGKIKVLLAEDNTINQFLAKSTLANWGFTVEVATNGREVITLHEQHPYDLILMDIQMPEMDGLEATKRIRQLPNRLKSRIPIIALTANGMPGDCDLYLAAGMNAYLSKPYEEEQLFRTIARTLGRQASARHPRPGGNVLPPGPAAPLYSLAHIQSLSRGNAVIIRHMLELFQQHTPRHLQELQQSLLACNWVQVSETAHNLKTSIDLLLITSVQEEIRFIEMQARHKTNLGQLAPVVSKVVLTLEQILDQILAKELNLIVKD
jgi:CheY-like chemotaxis protein